MALLQEHNMTRYRLAKMVSGNKMHIYEICGGFARASKGYQERISAVLGKDTKDLFNEFGVAKLVQ